MYEVRPRKDHRGVGYRTDYEFLKGVDYIFVCLDRNLSGEECHELAEKYFETHKQTDFARTGVVC